MSVNLTINLWIPFGFYMSISLVMNILFDVVCMRLADKMKNWSKRVIAIEEKLLVLTDFEPNASVSKGFYINKTWTKSGIDCTFIK